MIVMRYLLWSSLVPLLFCLWPSTGEAHQESAALLQEVRFEQRLGAPLPLATWWHDSTGKMVQLGEYFTTQPVILVLGYSSCSRLCPLVLEGLVRSLRALPWNVGDAFTVLAVSIDPHDTAARAAAVRTTVLQQYARPETAQGWHFLTGDAQAILQLTQAVGFYYGYDTQQEQFAHASGIMLVTPEGKLARYLYGIDYAVRTLRLGLVEASAGTIGSPVDQLLLRCYHYDPQTGRYNLAVLRGLQWLGGGTVVTLGMVISVLLYREWRGDTLKTGPRRP